MIKACLHRMVGPSPMAIKGGAPTRCAGPLKYERRFGRGVRTQFFCEAHGDWYASINPFGGLVQIRTKETK